MPTATCLRSRPYARAFAIVATLLLACEGGDLDGQPDASLDPTLPARDAAASTLDAQASTASSTERDAGDGSLGLRDAASPLPDAGPVGLRGPSGPSAGCGKPAPGGDGSAWSKHELRVRGVGAQFLAGGARYGSQQGYDFTQRNFFLRLPAHYDPNTLYPLVFSGGGCGATDGVSGKGGGSNPLPDDQADAVQVGLSYVYPSGAGACFADGFSDTPDLPYFDAVLAALDAAYCFDRAKVFVSGFSSGAWETYMLGCARGGVIRGIGTQAGGLRKERPVCANKPLAAFLTAGVNDDNPISDVDKTGFDSGSSAARDVILKTNGCTSNETTPYVTKEAPADWNCVRYSSCPAAYPVIWCAITADGGKHGAGSNKAFWPFWRALPMP